jgi:transcription elongation factor GreA
MYRPARVLYKAQAWDYNRVRKVVGMFHHLSGILRSRRWRGPAMAQPNYLSREGLEKLQAELEYLRTVRRHDVAASIQQSRERGGTVSNAEYEESKNELAFTEGRILTLDNLINNAVIIDENRGAADIVEVGAIVTVENQDGKNYEYTITGSAEADPSQGKISNVSPIGKALLGKRVGEISEVNIPSGKIRLKILAIG